MKRREWILAAVGIVMLAAGWLWNRANQIAPHTLPVVIEANGCRLPASEMFDHQAASQFQPVVIVFHGLAANRKIMQPLDRSLARSNLKVIEVDLPGHGDNTEPFTFARAEECAAAAVHYVIMKKQVPQEHIILAGHSMGGAIAIRLAKQFPNTAATIALSPAPEILPQWAPQAFLPYPPAERIPGNLLIVMAQLDLPFSGASAEGILKRGGGPGESLEDFAQHRALRVATVPYTAHTSVMFEEQTAMEVGRWLQRTLGESTRVRVRIPTLLPLWMGVAGMFLMSPLTATLVVRILRGEVAGDAPDMDLHSELDEWWRWLVAGGAASLMLWAARPFISTRIYERDYFPIFLLLSGGLILLARKWKTSKAAQLRIPSASQPASFQMRFADGEWCKIAAGVLFAFFVMLGFGWWLDLNIYDAWLNGPRWIRFALLVPVLLAFSIAEEAAVGSIAKTKNPSGGWRTEPRRYANRFAGYLARRFVLWLVLLAAIFVFSSGQILLMLAAVYMTSFTVGQRIAVDAVWRRTDSLAAAAAANAILSAWFLSLFPMT
jgi:pimeloyl-ACP methyl ester carboxylesterase